MGETFYQSVLSFVFSLFNKIVLLTYCWMFTGGKNCFLKVQINVSKCLDSRSNCSFSSGHLTFQPSPCCNQWYLHRWVTADLQVPWISLWGGISPSPITVIAPYRYCFWKSFISVTLSVMSLKSLPSSLH